MGAIEDEKILEEAYHKVMEHNFIMKEPTDGTPEASVNQNAAKPAFKDGKKVATTWEDLAP